MSTHKEAVRAVEELNGRELNGLLLLVTRAVPFEERKRQLQVQTENFKRENREKYEDRKFYVKNFN